jgi:hypothetical protein
MLLVKGMWLANCVVQTVTHQRVGQHEVLRQGDCILLNRALLRHPLSDDIDLCKHTIEVTAVGGANEGSWLSQAGPTVFFWVSVAVIPVFSPFTNACSMSDSIMVLTFHSTM